MNDPSTQISVLARLVTDSSTAHRLFDALVPAFEGGGTAVAACEEPTGAWTVEIYFAHAPDQEAVRTRIGDLAGNAVGERLVFSTVAARDWVAQSLEGLAPVAAGRFVVHGAHAKSDRRRDRGGARLRHRAPRHDAWLPHGARPDS
jgi:ribosomal protein L11 methyltransferase